MDEKAEEGTPLPGPLRRFDVDPARSAVELSPESSYPRRFSSPSYSLCVPIQNHVTESPSRYPTIR
jgi:hypothetical protein